MSSYSIIADSAECQRVVDSHGDPLHLFLCLGGGGPEGKNINNLGNLELQIQIVSHLVSVHTIKESLKL